MNKYLNNPESVIDFHGHTLEEAQVVLNDLLSKRRYSHVRIIVGKGLHSKDGPVLKTFVKNYLHKKNVRFTQSKIQDGGEGAMEAYLT
jgi:DNA-nicking Smr family endonuclease